MSRPWIIDGGLATGLEKRGHRLHPRLWSAGVFLENPRAVEDLHAAYLDAGAEILVTASYQMSFEALAQEGLEPQAAAAAMQATVATARRAGERCGRAAMVAASIGPYGATLADGSEYRGEYGLTLTELVEFHRPRFDALRTAGADLLAIETLPSLDEARAFAQLLAPHRSARAWISFSCKDGKHLSEGTPIFNAASLLDSCPQVVAIGINCTAPRHVASLMDEIRRASRKRIVVYPNSGESWDAVGRRWSGKPDEFLGQVGAWADRGAWAIGGCCRVGPELIGELSARLGRLTARRSGRSLSRS